MIRIENTEIFGWKTAIQEMRIAINSQEKSDSCKCQLITDECNNKHCKCCGWASYDLGNNPFCLGQNDLQLMKKLINYGPECIQFMEMIIVTCSITAPGYWWQEFDSYKISRNGHNTTHKIHEKAFELDDFSYENLVGEGIIPDHVDENPYDTLCNMINTLNFCRETYKDTKDKKWWWQMIQLLPSSYNQHSEVLLNYQTLRIMYHSRKNHNLDEWCNFCDWIETLPYSELIIGGIKNDD